METPQVTGTGIDITVNSITTCYDDLGKGVIPIIFIHGFPFDKSSWQPQMEFLKETQRVIAYDIRGFGKSTRGDEKESINLFADDLIKFMDGLEIDKAIVCGLSMGGYILLNAINRYPERFRAIILSDTQCIADSPEVKEKRMQTIFEVEKDGVKDFADGFIKKVFCPESLQVRQALVEKIREVILSTSPLTITGTLTAMAERWEMCSTLNKISVPTLILCGKEDIVTPPVQSQFLNNKIAHSQLFLIDNAGHMANLEQADEFNQRITDFVSDLVMKNL